MPVREPVGQVFGICWGAVIKGKLYACACRCCKVIARGLANRRVAGCRRPLESQENRRLGAKVSNGRFLPQCFNRRTVEAEQTSIDVLVVVTEGNTASGLRQRAQ